MGVCVVLWERTECFIYLYETFKGQTILIIKRMSCKKQVTNLFGKLVTGVGNIFMYIILCYDCIFVCEHPQASTLVWKTSSSIRLCLLGSACYFSCSVYQVSWPASFRDSPFSAFHQGMLGFQMHEFQGSKLRSSGTHS